jgi:cysteine desulfurase
MHYLDNAATTKVSKEVFDAMKPYFTTHFGNPSSIHQAGIENRKAINQARHQIASLLHADASEIVFTSGGTEASNLCLKGLAFTNHTKGEIITTKVEHHATLNTVKFLENLGYSVFYLNVDKEGFIDLEELRALLTPNTLVVSIILANNEIGTIQQIQEIKELCDQASTYLHVDAVQAITHIPINIHELGVDFMSISAHKFHGPKGIGALYIKKGIELTPLIHGGSQEKHRRAGTENVPYIIGFAKALELGQKDLADYRRRLDDYSDYLLNRLAENEIIYRLNGPKIGPNRLPGNLSLTFPNCDCHDLQYHLHRKGIYVSTSSACDSDSIEISHVIKAIYPAYEDHKDGAIRVSLGTDTKYEDIDAFVSEVASYINKG